MDVKKLVRALWSSAWVGWEVESNWTEPFIFIGLQVIRPLASTLLFPLLYLVGMNFIGRPVDPNYLGYIFVGTAFFTPYIFAAETGGTIVSQDRERYGVMKSIYITTSSLSIYFLGRFLAVAAISLFSTLSSFAAAYALIVWGIGYSMPLRLENLLDAFLALGAIYIGSFAIFFILPSINLLTNKLQWSLTYYFLGLLYLLGDIIFPVQSLSPLAEPLAYILPTNQALNTLRDALGLPTTYNTAAAYLASILWAALGYFVFKRAVGRARAKGLLDKIGWW
ncbi:conserved hypothetical protein [Candidatus Caldarchaeum subterraneum]|uniref:Hypothetical conserved protein n=1 Tax=Caldiarchaeum subterraneum TaxID=311458 RepID=Q4LED6_CALS0|nr:hypothetical conserved protein [Candidatus Caldarchaeum subterraneum]BAJ48957.1 hypothetical conserved protein [Candidatus Caldarchaeum subterraneum]BAJ51582.1 conserved hypothetical protein [Candidatus Caldarchaeum subterraneum]